MPPSNTPTAAPRINLDGEWDFSFQGGPLRTAVVPQPWQAQFDDLRHSFGSATYARKFARPKADGREVYLCFGAVSDRAMVSVNGVEIGRNDGGYLPFEMRIPSEILRDINEITVAVHLPSGADTAPSFAQIPHGKQSWYGPLGGIWQSVYLEMRAPLHLAHVGILASLAGRVTANLTLRGADAAPDQGAATIEVYDPHGHKVAQTAASIARVIEVQFDVNDPHLWSPDTPNLYELVITLAGHATRHSFGFRQFESRDGRFYLNGAPFFMRAALDQDYYQGTICTPPSIAFLENQLRRAKELGLNMLRCHIKVPDPRYYEVADRLGMLIWTEIPNVGQFTRDAAARMRRVMEGILARDGNHPCIVIWTLINEDWGTRLCENTEHRTWLAREFDWLKQRDPQRLVVDNSPCNASFHVKTDINDFHYYRSIPERRSEWDALTAEFAAGAGWTFAQDASATGTEPLVVSEFGVWGLPHPEQILDDGAEPWWMETGSTWGDGVAYPHGIQNRFSALHLGTVFGNFDAFVTAAQWYQFANLKYEIEVMRAHAAIQGYVITEFTDVHWESNGLLDMNRNPRVFHNRFAQINSDVVIVPKLAHYAVWAGAELGFDLAVATGGAALSGGVLHWETDEGASGQIAFAGAAAQTADDVGRVNFAPKDGAHRRVSVRFWLEIGGQTIAQNAVELAVYQRLDFAALPAVSVADDAMERYCVQLGLRVVPQGQGAITLARNLDAGDIGTLQSGARYLLLAGDQTDFSGKIRSDAAAREQPFIPVVDDIAGVPMGEDLRVPNFVQHARHGSIWRGDWIAGFSWIRRTGVFADMPGGPMVDISLDRVIPHHVLTGFRQWEFGGPIHAGVVVGWVHKPAAFIAERRVGSGGLVATTFRLMQDAAGQDPVASYLLHALIRLAAMTPVDRP